ncbi:hypothetical protein M1M25_gp106 [Tenacibaculum phage Gundel_1]|uniref:Uncharacterized protein n=1 Tax=Tenacibaculum phage Gundel_1 TaxID=2745672 RepID=A0A8E5E9R8_9CAUD|nr:hypothetical protein M1M25_gp106 [Tenacibaculum phage Gundel_1]QQV91435.1 hypothetical protein Gundel1_112 [Tenacibaculum phage Gundel_1]
MAINKKLKHIGIAAHIGKPSCVGKVFLLAKINKTPVVFKTPCHENTETDKDGFVCTGGLFAQLEKAVAESPTPLRDISFKDIEKAWNDITSISEKQGVFGPFDNPYLTPQNRKDINKAMVEYQEAQGYSFGKRRIAGWNNIPVIKKPTIDILDNKSKYHK